MNNDRLKFRVWSKKSKRYMGNNASYSIDESGLLHVHIFGQHYELENTEDFEVEQCTGLKDKNGNLIYENDRVGFYVYGQDEEWHRQQGTVIWHNSCYGVETSSRFIQFENELTIKDPKDIEIIGNIHEQKDKQ